MVFYSTWRVKRSSFPVFLVSLTISILVVACAVGAEQPLPLPTSTLQPTKPPTLTPIPTATDTPFVPKATLKIVSHSPLTGGYSRWGMDIMRAVELASQELVEPLHYLGYAVELISYDDQDSIEKAVLNANEIVADPEILCGVGHYTSRITIQTTEIYHKAGLAFICPSCTIPTVTDRHYLEVNRVAGRDDNQGKVGAQFVKAQGWTNVFVISQNSIYAQKNADYFKREARQIGITIIGDLKTDVMEKFEPFISRILAANPDVVYFSTVTTDQAGAFIREVRAAGYQGVLLGPDALNNPALPISAGPLMVDGGGTYFTTTYAQPGDQSEAADFMTTFETRYGSLPVEFSAQAYDAAGICLQAIETASLARAGEIPSRKDVANAIRTMPEYHGITGNFSFNKDGDPNLVNYFIYKVTSVDPETWNTNPMIASFEIAPP